VQFRGHAIECRVSAEDPYNRFFPSTGRVTAVREPAGPGIRLDASLEPGLAVSLHYDPLLAKLIVWGEDRASALRRMRRALGEYLVLGVSTTIPFHRWLMDQSAFQAGDLDTGFVERHWREGAELEDHILERAAVLAALAHLEDLETSRPIPARHEIDGRWLSAARRAALRLP
jgi:acetyl/propionyl-CoA carboxylase alpha subunit